MSSTIGTQAPSLTDGEPLLTEHLRGGAMWSRTLRRGQRLRLVDLEGTAAVAALFYNSHQSNERYCMPDTLKAQHLARLTAGVALYSDMGRVLCSIVADSLGWHDTITGHADARMTFAKYGEGTYQRLRCDYYRNSHDNFLVELGKHGLGKRDIVANVNFFVKVVVNDQGDLEYMTRHSHPLAFVELRAEIDTLVVLSNTPHPLDPRTEYAPGAVRLELRHGPVAPEDDLVRNACPENTRGFALSERYCL